ncbi:MAG: M23 family metallopeptidase [Hyphomicrobiales bacterium]
MASRFFNKKSKWTDKWTRKYRIAIQNDQTFEERANIIISKGRVALYILMFALFVILATSCIIIYTPVRHLIPGYMDINYNKEYYSIMKLSDSVSMQLEQNQAYLNNIKHIITDSLPNKYYSIQNSDESQGEEINYDTITLKKSKADSNLRLDFENQHKYGLSNSEKLYNMNNFTVENMTFIAPLIGTITDSFDIVNSHFGIDIVAPENEAIKAAQDGTVIFSDWTADDGHVIAVQHSGNFVSVYKHNSVILKKTGEHIRAGDPIAIIGESGHLAYGPHLHFELWYNGTPVNPTEYIVF